MAKTYATTPLNFMQFGTESTKGTPVAATKIWRGVFSPWSDDRETETHEETIGILWPEDVTYDVWLAASIAMAETNATFEQLGVVIDSGFMENSVTGAGPYDFTWDYPTDSTVPDFVTRTLEIGNVNVPTDQHELSYSFLEQFQLSGAQKEAWKVQGTWRGNRSVQAARTAALTLDAIEPMKFSATTLYVDDGGGTIGTTQLTGVLMDFALTVNSGIMLIPVGDGTMYSTNHKRTRPSATFSITFELEEESSASTVATERAAYDAKTIRLIRLTCAGTNGRSFTIDLAGRYTEVGPYADTDGNTTVTFQGVVSNSTTDSLNLAFALTHPTIATLP